MERRSSPIPRFEPQLPNICSAYPDDLDNLAAGMSDEQALKRIGQRSTLTGKLMFLAVGLGALGLGWMSWQNSRAYDSRMEGLLAAGKLEGPAMLTALREELAKAKHDDVKERAIRNLAHFRDQQAVPQFIAALDDGGIVRRAAALGLAEIGSPAADPAKPKLLEVLPQTDERDRTQVVWALAVLKESAASDAILTEFTSGRLQAQPRFDPAVVTRALGIAKLSSPELTGHAEKSVRALVAMALSEAASPQVVDPLVRMIQNPNEDPEVVRAAVAGLGRTGDPRAGAPLFALTQRRPEMRSSVVDALGKSTAAPQLASLLTQATDVNAKRDLVRLLRKTSDPRAAEPLASVLGEADEEIKQEAALGLSELGDERAVPVLLALASSEERETSADAIDALRQLGSASAAPGLLALFDKAPQNKAAIIRALGATGAQAAGPRLLKELKGDDVGAAARALGQLKYAPAYPVLLGMLPRKKYKDVDFSRPGVPSEMAYRDRLEAMNGLAYFGRVEPKLVKELTTIVEDADDDARLGRIAGATLGSIADPPTYQTMVAKISDKQLDERVRTSYAAGLWRKPNPAFTSALLPLLNQPDAPGGVRSAAALAIGYAGDPANDAGLLSMLERPDARRYVSLAAVLGGGEAVARKMLEVLPKDRETEEILRGVINDPDADDFNLLTRAMFDSGQIYRRLRAAEILMEGSGETSYSYVFAQVTARLRAGWDGPGGMSDREVRNALFKELGSNDPARRRLVAVTLSALNLRGPLLAARDAGIQEARDVLLAAERPRAQEEL
jgi:HEAT repeat protein